MKRHSRLLLVENLLPEKNKKDYGFLMDLQMLIQQGGRERADKTGIYRAFQKSGLPIEKGPSHFRLCSYHRGAVDLEGK